jgi:hypothetical protein
MPYAEKTGIPHVGDRVRHFAGKVGTVIFVQRDAAGTQAHEHIRVRWDNDSTQVAPHLADRYTLVPLSVPQLEWELTRWPEGAEL